MTARSPEQQKPMQPVATDPIRDYIRANMPTHTREAIYAGPTAAGHDPSRVEAVWQEEWRSFALDRSVGNLRALSLSLYVLDALLGAFGALVVAGLASGSTNLSVFFIVYAIGYLGIGYGLSRLVTWGVRRYRLGGWRTFLLGALLFPVYVTLMFGGCIATLWIAQVAA